jgi:D-alanine-D-alanine ligase
MHSKLNVVLFVGGISPERAVSKSSSKSIYQALKNIGHNVKLIDPAYGLKQPENPEDFFSEKDLFELSARNYIDVVNSKYFDDIDIVFIGLHGKWGEDGIVQSLLELRGLKYTGSKVLSSAISMDKAMSKILFDEFGVTTPAWFQLSNNNLNISSTLEKTRSRFGFPCVVKPNDQGSTVGLTVCKNEYEFEEGIKLALNYSDKVLVEEFIPGHEMTVAILEGEVLPPLEIKPKHAFYDYECKYTSGMSEYIVPAEIPDFAIKRLQDQAMLAFNALNCKAYARADFRMTNDFQPYCLELNTLPGMTSLSLVPKMAKAAGISFEELIDRIIQLSLK